VTTKSTKIYTHENKDVYDMLFYFMICEKHVLCIYHSISTTAAFFSFAKTSIGSGSFVLAWAIHQSGVFLGSFGLILIGIIRYANMFLWFVPTI